MKFSVPKVGDTSNRDRCPCTGLVAPKIDVSNTYAADDVPSDSVSPIGVVSVESWNTAPVMREYDCVVTI